ncbi:MAG: ABC transporter substrate-binding protein, partial [Anaerolineae bacterium]|nr:ABC transporter substrate-binding protein [Anaerolineae bacterium]
VETDPTARYEVFAQFQRELAEKAPWIWLYAPYTYTAHQSYVTGWAPTSNDSLYFLYAVQLSR